MVDPLSISSAAVGFVSFALQVATTSANFVRDAKNFPEEAIKLSLVAGEFANHVRLLEPTIEKVNARYESENGNYDSRSFATNVLKIRSTCYNGVVRSWTGSTCYWCPPKVLLSRNELVGRFLKNEWLENWWLNWNNAKPRSPWHSLMNWCNYALTA